MWYRDDLAELSISTDLGTHLGQLKNVAFVNLAPIITFKRLSDQRLPGDTGIPKSKFQRESESPDSTPGPAPQSPHSAAGPVCHSAALHTALQAVAVL